MTLFSREIRLEYLIKFLNFSMIQKITRYSCNQIKPSSKITPKVRFFVTSYDISKSFH